MSKKSKKKNNLKEEKIMENNIEELNQNIEEVTEVTEENVNEIEELTNETEETIEESTEEVNKTMEQLEETVNEVEELTNEIEETIEEVTDEVIEPEVIVPSVENNVENNEVIGKISGFEKLYVRKEASKDSEPVGIVTDKDDLSIDVAHSTDNFYKVITSNGLEGYCVKQFINIK